MDRLMGMRVFAAVAERGSFSAAARDLGLSKSVVSKQIQMLEDHLSVRLINRTTRRLGLTDVGDAYLAWCRQIVDDVDEAEAIARSLHTEPKGRLRVNAPVSFGILHLAPVLPAFMQAHPDLEVDLSLNDRFVDLIEEGFDVAIRVGNLADSSLIARRLAPAHMVVVASPDYIARCGSPETPADLTDHECLIYANVTGSLVWRFEGPDGPVTVTPTGRLSVNNGDVMCNAAAHGIGITRLPTFIVADQLSDGSLVRLMPDFTMPGSAVHAVYAPNRHVSAKVRVFVDFLIRRFATSDGLAAWDRPIAHLLGNVAPA